MEMYDSLTGLYNKWGFFFKTQDVLKEDKETKYEILCSDIKHFKLVNDLFGMEAGDNLIKQMADKLKETDSLNGVFARLEADKFGILIPVEHAHEIIDLFVKTEFHVEGHDSYMVHVVIGVYEIDDRTVPVSFMCDRANMALDTIKEDMGVHVAYFREAMREQMLKEQLWIGEIQKALKNQEMMIYLQGLYDPEEKITGAEALVRWNHPVKGILTAGEFVEPLEKSGLIAYLDQYVWKLCCKQLKQWEREGRDNLFLSINISARDFETMDVCKVLTDLVNKYRIAPEKLRLELTETTLMNDFERNNKLIKIFREKGYIVEIDDFGSGYSSLNVLKDIVVDIVKLDMKFLEKSENMERSITILRAMIDLIKKLGMQVIVEGVETEEQFRFLKEYGCDAFQGYYFMRPMSIECFEKKLECQKES